MAGLRVLVSQGGLRPEIASISTLMFILTIIAIGLVALVLRRGGGLVHGHRGHDDRHRLISTVERR